MIYRNKSNMRVYQTNTRIQKNIEPTFEDGIFVFFSLWPYQRLVPHQYGVMGF